MIQISKEAAQYLTSHGVNYGENGISRTHGHHKHYYMCACEDNTDLLNEWKESIGLKIDKPKKPNKRYKKK